MMNGLSASRIGPITPTASQTRPTGCRFLHRLRIRAHSEALSMEGVMGFNATVVVLVDQLESIRRDASFGEKLAAAVIHKLNDPNGRRGDGPYVTGQTQVDPARSGKSFPV